MIFANWLSTKAKMNKAYQSVLFVVQGQENIVKWKLTTRALNRIKNGKKQMSENNKNKI